MADVATGEGDNRPDVEVGPVDDRVLDVDDRGWARDGAGPERRRPPRSAFRLVYAAFLAIVAAWIVGLLLLDAVDLLLIRSRGTPGTFVLSECEHRGGRRSIGHHVCQASFSGDDGSREPSVRVIVDESPEEGGTRRAGHLWGDHGAADEINAYLWTPDALFRPVLAAIVGVSVVIYYLRG